MCSFLNTDNKNYLIKLELQHGVHAGHLYNERGDSLILEQKPCLEKTRLKIAPLHVNCCLGARTLWF